MKRHLSRIVGNVKLAFEELTTVWVKLRPVLIAGRLWPCRAMITVSRHSHPDTSWSEDHLKFYRTRPFHSLPSHFCNDGIHASCWSGTFGSDCQCTEISQVGHPSKNIVVSSLSCGRMGWVPTRWPIVRITVNTSTGAYTHPVNKLALLLFFKS